MTPPALRRAIAALICLASCTGGPEGPKIPDPSLIGPAPPFALRCGPADQFAQRWFMIADLNTGKACTDFVEQDECVIAIFRDCTDGSANPRSWQGELNRDKPPLISLRRTNEVAGGGMIAASPSECEGPLTEEPMEGITTWAKLGCTLMTNGEHGGLYIERIPADDEPPVPPYARIDSTRRITVVPDNVGLDTVKDFVAFAQRKEIWAVVNEGSQSGLYVGSVANSSTQLSNTGQFPNATSLAASNDETHIFVGDQMRVHMVNTANMATATTAVESGQVLALKMTYDGLLVAVRAAMSTKLELRDATTFAVTRSTQISGEVVDIVPLYMESHPRLAALIFSNMHKIVVMNEMLQPEPLELMETPRWGVAIPGQNKIAVSVDNQPRYYELILGQMLSVSTTIKLPGMFIRGMHWDPMRGRLLIAHDEGDILPFDTTVDRPLLQQEMHLGARAELMRSDSSGQTFVLEAQEAVIDPLLR